MNDAHAQKAWRDRPERKIDRIDVQILHACTKINKLEQERNALAAAEGMTQFHWSLEKSENKSAAQAQVWVKAKKEIPPRATRTTAPSKPVPKVTIWTKTPERIALAETMRGEPCRDMTYEEDEQLLACEKAGVASPQFDMLSVQKLLAYGQLSHLLPNYKRVQKSAQEPPLAPADETLEERIARIKKEDEELASQPPVGYTSADD